MAQISFRIDDDLKAEAESILNEMGLTMSAAITVFLKKVSRERRIPFEISADPFYSKKNIAELEKRVEELRSGESTLKEHEPIESSADPFYSPDNMERLSRSAAQMEQIGTKSQS